MWYIIVVLAIVTVLGCSDPGASLEPLPGGDGYSSFFPEPVPEARVVQLDKMALRPEFLPNVLPIEIRFADSMLTWSGHDRLRLDLSTSDGDSEELLIWAEGICREGGARHLCYVFGLQMETGYSLDGLVPYIDAIRGEVLMRATGGAGGTITIHEGRLDSAMARARRWPHVAGVSLVHVTATDGLSMFLDQHLVFWVPQPTLAGARPPGGESPIELADPTPNDGRLQVRRGTIVRASYTQPGGTRLVTEARMP